jgi:gliding motility-associated-like protein
VGQHFYGMRRGPDNKVYILYNGNISVINNPNLAGPACNLSLNILNVNATYSFGSPIIPNSLNVTTYFSHDTTACLYFSPANLSGPAGYSSYLWSDGQTTQIDTISAAGTKWVTSSQFCNIRIDTFHVSATVPALTSVMKDTAACFVVTPPLLQAPAGDSYTWSDGFTIQQDTIGAPGIKWVQISDTSACAVLTDTFKVTAKLDTTFKVTDTTHCVAYSPIPIKAANGYTTYLWSDGTTTQTDTFFASTTKWVRAQNGCALLIDTIHFTAGTVPQDSIAMHGKDTTVCFETVATVNVSGPAGYTYYLWNDGTTQQADVFTAPGIKWVYAQKLCTLVIDTFTVVAQGTDTSTNSTDTTICFSSHVDINAPGGYASYLWSDGNTSQSDSFNAAGVKFVSMHKACATTIDTFSVHFVDGLSLDLGNDTSVCKGKTIDLDAGASYPGENYLWQDGSANQIYTVSDGGYYSVTVSVGPCRLSDSIRVQQSVVDLKIEDGIIPCRGEGVVLDAGPGNAYLWQDGSTKRTFKATKDGAYSVTVTQGVCSASATVNVSTTPCPCTIVIPEAFSPNHDGKNDYFGARANCVVTEFDMVIYNRWGNQVFHSGSVDDKWDGTYNGVAQDAGVYYYFAKLRTAQLTSYHYKGEVTLVR